MWANMPLSGGNISAVPYPVSLWVGKHWYMKDWFENSGAIFGFQSSYLPQEEFRNVSHLAKGFVELLNVVHSSLTPVPLVFQFYKGTAYFKDGKIMSSSTQNISMGQQVKAAAGTLRCLVFAC